MYIIIHVPTTSHIIVSSLIILFIHRWPPQLGSTSSEISRISVKGECVCVCVCVCACVCECECVCVCMYVSWCVGGGACGAVQWNLSIVEQLLIKCVVVVLVHLAGTVDSVLIKGDVLFLGVPKKRVPL